MTNFTKTHTHILKEFYKINYDSVFQKIHKYTWFISSLHYLKHKSHKYHRKSMKSPKLTHCNTPTKTFSNTVGRIWYRLKCSIRTLNSYWIKILQLTDGHGQRHRDRQEHKHTRLTCAYLIPHYPKHSDNISH